jgi:hypothetical protein
MAFFAIASLSIVEKTHFWQHEFQKKLQKEGVCQAPKNFFKEQLLKFCVYS